MASNRKSAIHITSAEIAAAEHRQDERRDNRPDPTTLRSNLLPSLASWRAARNCLTADELLKLCRAAARLELRGTDYSADDRADVAADIMRVVLIDTGGALPRMDSQRIDLTRLCGDAKNRRASIDAMRERDRRHAEDTANRQALEPSAMLPADRGETKAKHVHIVAKSSRLAGERAADSVCRDLSLPVDQDSPAWLVLYQWARDISGTEAADERGIDRDTYHVKAGRGRAFVTRFYTATELAARLTLGAAYVVPDEYETMTEYLDSTVPADRELLICTRDLSREAHGRTPFLTDVAHAPHWREGTSAGHAPERASTAAEARALCETWRRLHIGETDASWSAASRIAKRTADANRKRQAQKRGIIRVDRKLREHRFHGTVQYAEAQSIAAGARASTAGRNRRERAAARTSDMARAAIGH